MSKVAGDKKVISRVSKKVGINQNQVKQEELGLMDQYSIIREDLVRLRDDVVKGYGMTRTWLDKKGSVKNFFLRSE
jgi:hypothetical protein